jgi:spore maturation protein CgeB
MAMSVVDFASLSVVLDNPFYIPRDNFITLWTPQDTRIYNDLNLPRDIDVSFMGSINGYGDRSHNLNHLCSHCGANIKQLGGQREHNLTPQDYANHLQRSKISLSFSKTRNGLQQTKGRPFEITLCGAMLMEDANLGTSLWFEPFKDYVPFMSPDDLADKVNYYLSNPSKMAEITASGKQKSTFGYSPLNWWRIVLSKVGLA